MAVCARSHPRTGDQRSARRHPRRQALGVEHRDRADLGPGLQCRRQVVGTGGGGDHRAGIVEDRRDHDVEPFPGSGRAEQGDRVLHARPAPLPAAGPQQQADIGRLGVDDRGAQRGGPPQQRFLARRVADLAAVREPFDPLGVIGGVRLSRVPQPPRPVPQQGKEGEGEERDRPVQAGRADRRPPPRGRVGEVSERGQLPERMPMRDAMPRQPGRRRRQPPTAPRPAPSPRPSRSATSPGPARAAHPQPSRHSEPVPGGQLGNELVRPARGRRF